jgi:hypothetical protein
MNPDPSSSLEPAEDTWREVSDPRAARALLDPASLRFLRPFLGRERSVAEAAAEIGAPLDTMLYRARRLEALGLLEVARLEPRKGRAVKRYRSVANGFRVPPRAAPPGGAETVLNAAGEYWQRRLVRGVLRALGDEDGPTLRVFRTRDGRVRSDVAPGDPPVAGAHGAAVMDATMLIRLEEEEARAFQRDLLELWQRYAGRHERGRWHLARLSLAPTDGPDADV